MSERKEAARKGRVVKRQPLGDADKRRAEQQRKAREVAAEGARKHARTLDELAK